MVLSHLIRHQFSSQQICDPALYIFRRQKYRFHIGDSIDVFSKLYTLTLFLVPLFSGHYSEAQICMGEKPVCLNRNFDFDAIANVHIQWFR